MLVKWAPVFWAAHCDVETPRLETVRRFFLSTSNAINDGLTLSLCGESFTLSVIGSQTESEDIKPPSTQDTTSWRSYNGVWSSAESLLCALSVNPSNGSRMASHAQVGKLPIHHLADFRARHNYRPRRPSSDGAKERWRVVNACILLSLPCKIIYHCCAFDGKVVVTVNFRSSSSISC